MQWISAVYVIYTQSLTEDTRALELDAETEADLRTVLKKRVQLDSFWHLEGVQMAEQELINTREGLYRAISEANRLFVEAAQSADPVPSSVLSRLANILVSAMNSPLVWIGLVAPGESRINVVAAEGDARESAHKAVISVDPALPEGNGPTGLAIRTGSPQFIQDAASDPRFAPWHKLAVDYGLGSFGVAPFSLTDGRRGVLALTRPVSEPFPTELADVLMRFATDLGAFLDHCEELRELERMRRYRTALSAMQYLLLQDPSPEAIYHSLGELLLEHTDALSTTVWVYEPDSRWLRPTVAVARDETTTARLKTLEVSLDPANRPQGLMFTPRVFRARKPIVLSEPHQDPELQIAWQNNPVHQGVRSIGGWPIILPDESAPSAVLTIQGLDRDYFSNPLRELLDQLVGSVSLAIAHHRRRLRVEQLSLHDPLTGLPNRAYFKQTAKDAMSRAQRARRPFALGVLDLDRFKDWNDTLGHLSGDSLLQNVANSLGTAMRHGEGVARLGGDEFGIHVILDSHKQLHQISSRLLKAVAKIEHEDGRMTGSLGWALFPDDGTDFETLFAHADAALYGAKDAGRNSYKIFHDDIAQEVHQRFSVRKTFPEALDNGEIEFFLQPQANIGTGELDGAELLVRWRRLNEHVSPAEFMPAVERDRDMIRALGCAALREAVQVRSRLADAGLPLQVAVNIGAGHFLEPDFLEDVAAALDGGDAEGLTIEITETTTLPDLAQARRIIRLLKERGFRLSLDDFGTGYASLHYAASLPVDELKVDQHFIRRFRASPRSLAVVGTAVLLGQLTGQSVIAEGIETSQDSRLWMHMGGNRIQGYLLTPPLPQDRFLHWARNWMTPASPDVPRFPVEELPLLAQIFRDADDSDPSKYGISFDNCPLSRWFRTRVNHYGQLGSWPLADELHRQFHRLADGLREQPRVVDRKAAYGAMQEALRELYDDIGASLISEERRLPFRQP